MSLTRTEKLHFLDTTLQGMIQRFEAEYPECRITLQIPLSHRKTNSETGSLASSFTNPFDPADTASELDLAIGDTANMSDDEGETEKTRITRQGSDVSIASHRLVQEEGRMHRFGQQLRREILRPQTGDYTLGTQGKNETQARHLQDIRKRLEAADGDEIKEQVEKYGPDSVLESLGATHEDLFLLEQQDPEGFERFKDSQLTAWINTKEATRTRDDTKG